MAQQPAYLVIGQRRNTIELQHTGGDPMLGQYLGGIQRFIDHNAIGNDGNIAAVPQLRDQSLAAAVPVLPLSSARIAHGHRTVHFLYRRAKHHAQLGKV